MAIHYSQFEWTNVDARWRFGVVNPIGAITLYENEPRVLQRHTGGSFGKLMRGQGAFYTAEGASLNLGVVCEPPSPGDQQSVVIRRPEPVAPSVPEAPVVKVAEAPAPLAPKPLVPAALPPNTVVAGGPERTTTHSAQPVQQVLEVVVNMPKQEPQEVPQPLTIEVAPVTGPEPVKLAPGLIELSGQQPPAAWPEIYRLPNGTEMYADCNGVLHEYKPPKPLPDLFVGRRDKTLDELTSFAKPGELDKACGAHVLPAQPVQQETLGAVLPIEPLRVAYAVPPCPARNTRELLRDTQAMLDRLRHHGVDDDTLDRFELQVAQQLNSLLVDH